MTQLHRTMKTPESSTQILLHLRILVQTLGEVHHAGWWKSQFLSPIGLNFLERIYPRRAFAAAVRSAGRSALSVHDANIGKGSVFHLFRLPRHLERELDRELTERSDQLATRLEPVLGDRAALQEQLAALADDVPASSAVGPVALSADSTDLAPDIAAVYIQAFREGTQAFPYFEAAEVDL